MKPGNIRLFVTDMDGTLLGKDFGISSRNVEAVRRLKEHDIEFAVATGRIYCDAVGICRRCGLEPYVISNNGACVFDKSGNMLYSRPIKREDLIWLTGYLEAEGICYGLGESGNYVTAGNWEEILDAEVASLHRDGTTLLEEWITQAKRETLCQYGIRFVDSVREHLKKEIPVYSVSLVSFHQEKLEALRIEANKRELELSSSGMHSTEVMLCGATKGIALDCLCGELRIQPENIAAVGDGLNDLDMIQKAGVSFAAAKGNPALLEESDYVVGADSEDRIAEAIEMILKNDT